MLGRFLQIQSMEPQRYFNSVYIPQKEEDEDSPRPDSICTPISRKRRRDIFRPPPSPDPRRRYLSNRKSELLKSHFFFGPPQGVDDFEIIKRLNSGRFGEVYLVRNRLSRAVSVLKKSIHPLIGEEELKRARIQSKLLSLFTKKQPHLLQHYSSWVEDARVYVHLAWCQGGDLQTRIRQKPLSNEIELKRLICEVGMALALLHNMDIIHRDVKPANIFLDSKGHYVLGDFGHITRAQNPISANLDRWYMADEALRGTQTPKGDIFSLGVTAIVSAGGGANLDPNKSRSEALYAQAKQSNLSAGLKTTILRMISKDWMHRPSADAIVRKIRQGDPGVLSTPRGSKTRALSPPAPRNNQAVRVEVLVGHGSSNIDTSKSSFKCRSISSEQLGSIVNTNEQKE
uniref:Protein kinase domain-containing protein n=1 Tax=Lotharella globosa TaxID=91324 RepID=A0A7S3Z9T0_9EUKA|mmetsp:Transcript_16124/g.32675  ORF Transcript_16124/g.32675 Transcript_16124/m.32675 type:complete len:400 (+) Transcript_16124:44-1243(+)